MRYTEFLRIEKLKRIFDWIAYGSLGIDIAIALVTLVSLNIYSKQLDELQYFLNIALTVEVIVTLVVLAMMLLVRHYEKVIDNLALFSRALSGKKKKGQKGAKLTHLLHL